MIELGLTRILMFMLFFPSAVGIIDAFTLNLTFLRGAGPIIENEAV